MAKGVTLGSDPITGVYVGSDLATGLYIGSERVWPLQTGVVSIGHGTFNFLPQPLAVETDQVIRIAPAALTFVGRPLSVSIGGMVSVWIAPGTFHFTGRPLATRADAAIALGAGTVQFHGQALGLGVGGAVAVSIQAGAVQFSGAALTVEVGTSAAVGLDAGSLNFTGAVLTVTATANVAAALDAGAFTLSGSALEVTTTANAKVSIGAGSFNFTGEQLLLSTGQSVAASLNAGSLTFTGQTLAMSANANASVDIGAGSVAFTGQALGVLADMSVDMGAGSFDLSGQPLAVTASSSGTSPSLVQSTYDNVFLPSISIALDTAPTAGHLLTLNVFPDAGQTITTPPDGFTACDRTGENTSRPTWVYYKIADGSEQTVSADLSSSAGVGAVYSEWQDATTVSALTGTSFNPGISSGTAGPSAAPPNASAIPIYWLVSRAQTPYVATVGTGWTIDPNYAGNVNYAPCQAYMTSAPNEAVSIDFTLTGTDSSYFQWTTAWIY